MNEIENLLKNQILEIRRGTIVLAILHHVKKPRYGYELLESLEKSGIAVEAGTLYPLLRRLDKQGVLESHWNTQEARPRKFYKLSKGGKQLQKKLTKEWKAISQNLENIINRQFS